METIDPFYQRVMAIALRGGPPPKAKPKKGPKSKGKKPKTPGFEVSPDVDALDVFKTVLEGDAGAESSHQNFYSDHLSKLSKAKLKKLRRKINRVRDHYLEHPETNESITRVQDMVDSASEEQLRQSLSYEADIAERVRDHLDQLEIGRTKKRKKRIEFVEIEGEMISLNRLCRRYFQDEVEEFDRHLAEGRIIPDIQGLTGRGFVRKVIRYYLTS
jgi:hypothetical protein